MYKLNWIKKLKWYVFFLPLLFTLAACGNNDQKVEDNSKVENTKLLETPYEDTKFYLGTYVSLKVYDEGKAYVLDESYDRVKTLEDELSANKSNTEITDINKAAGKEAVKVSQDVMDLLEVAEKYSAIENSGFDYTIGAITDLWRIGFDDARVPDDSEIIEKLPLVNHNKSELNLEDRTVYLEEEGMKIDLGAIAKGYIADQIAKVYKENGVTSGIIDLGGNVLVIGDSPKRPEGGWNVGVQDPNGERGSYIGTINIKNQSIVTSGIYERYIEKDGKVYPHLMNPKTGYPFDNNLASVTILTKQSTDADGLSTVVFGFGLDDGLKYVNNTEGVEAIFITKDNEVYLSDGIKDRFQLTNDNFTRKN